MTADDDEGFGTKSYFDARNPWKKWKVLDTLPTPDLSDRPIADTNSFEDNSDREDKADCPPVTNTDGDPIYY